MMRVAIGWSHITVVAFSNFFGKAFVLALVYFAVVVDNAIKVAAIDLKHVLITMCAF